jgi:hypothetical protein
MKNTAGDFEYRNVAKNKQMPPKRSIKIISTSRFMRMMNFSKTKVLTIIKIAFNIKSAGKNAIPYLDTNAAVITVQPIAPPILKKKVISQHSVTRDH